MFYNKSALTRFGFLLGLMCSSVQLSHAENISNFETVLAKVQQYQNFDQFFSSNEKIAQLNIAQSKLWQNPNLSIDQTGFGSDQDQEINIGISQPLDVFGERKLNQSIARTFNEKLQIEQQLWQNQSASIVRFSWVQCVLANLEYSSYLTQFQISQENLNYAKKRYQAGNIALVDVERAQIELLESQRALQQANLNLQTQQQQLAHLWGAVKADFEIDQSTQSWPVNTKQLVEKNIAESVLEKLYALNTKQSAQQIEALKLQNRPQPNLSLGVRTSQSPKENSETALALGIEVPLNIFNRQQFTIPIVQQQQILLNQQQQKRLNQQILNIGNYLNQIDALKTQYNLIHTQIEYANKVQQRSLVGFQVGKLSYTDVQLATNQIQNLRLAQIQILQQAWKSAFSAEAISIGSSYEEISAPNALDQLTQKMANYTTDSLSLGVSQ